MVRRRGQLRVGVVGTGAMGLTHAWALMNNPQVRVVAVCSRSAARAEQFARGQWPQVPYFQEQFQRAYPVERCYTDCRAMAQDPELDAVTICTPNALHAPQAIAFLNGGKHVLVEKPMAGTVRDAQAMLQAARDAKRVLCAAHCWRFHPDVQFVRQLVADGLIGRVVKVKGYGIHLGWAPGGWFTDPQLAQGGALLDMGIHAIDTARYLLGDVAATRVYAYVGSVYGDHGLDDVGFVAAEFTDGARAVLEFGWTNPHRDGDEASTQLFGTQGYARVFPTCVRHRSGDRWVQLQPDPVPHTTLDTYQRQIDHFVNCALANQESDVISGQQGYQSLLVVDAAYASGRSGKLVEVRP